MTHPEQLPTDTKNNFLFSFSSVATAQSEIQKEFDALNERIQAIVESEKFHVQNFPVLRNIIALQPDKAELKKLSKALDRLGDLMESYATLNARLNMVKMMQEHPTWFTSTFADYEGEIDRSLDKFFYHYE